MSSTPLKIKREVLKPVFIGTPKLCKFYTLYPDMDKGFTSYRCEQPATEDGYCIFHSPSGGESVEERFAEVLERGLREGRCVFVGYRLPELKLKGRTLDVNMHFSQAKIGLLEIENCEMRGLDLSDAEIGELKLRRCELTRLNLSGASVRKISMEETKVREFYTLWSEVEVLHVRGSKVDSANFSGMRSKEVSLHGGIICGSDVEFTNERLMLRGESKRIKEVKPFSIEVEGGSIPIASFSDAEIEVLRVAEMDISLISMAKGKFGRVELRKVRLPRFNGKEMLLDEILVLLGAIDREDLLALKNRLILEG